MLSNLYDFNPDADRVPFDQLPELLTAGLCSSSTIWLRLSKKSYEDFDFRQIIHELDYFCAVNMSAVYLDILKDRVSIHSGRIRLAAWIADCAFDIVVALAKSDGPDVELYSRRDLANASRKARKSHLGASRSIKGERALEPVPEKLYRNGGISCWPSDGRSCWK
jgi:hypothetical protein